MMKYDFKIFNFDFTSEGDTLNYLGVFF
jgi:hypothetical protein